MYRKELYTYRWNNYTSLKVVNDLANPLKIIGTFQKGNEVAIVIYCNYKEYACIIDLGKITGNREVKTYKIVISYLRDKNIHLIKVLGFNDVIIKTVYLNINLEMLMPEYEYKVFGKYIYIDIPKGLSHVIFDSKEDKLYKLSCIYSEIEIESVTNVEKVDNKVFRVCFGSTKVMEFNYYEIQNELEINKLINMGEGDTRCLENTNYK